MYSRTTFYGFGSTTATYSPSNGRRRLPVARPSRGSWCRSPTTLFSSEGDLSSPPSTRLQTGSFNQHRATENTKKTPMVVLKRFIKRMYLVIDHNIKAVFSNQTSTRRSVPWQRLPDGRRRLNYQGFLRLHRRYQRHHTK